MLHKVQLCGKMVSNIQFDEHVNWVRTMCWALYYVVGEGSTGEPQSLPLNCCPTWNSSLPSFLMSHLHPGSCPTGCDALLNSPTSWVENHVFSLDDSILTILSLNRASQVAMCVSGYFLLVGCHFYKTESQTVKILTQASACLCIFRNSSLLSLSYILMLMH